MSMSEFNLKIKVLQPGERQRNGSAGQSLRLYIIVIITIIAIIVRSIMKLIVIIYNNRPQKYNYNNTCQIKFIAIIHFYKINYNNV